MAHPRTDAPDIRTPLNQLFAAPANVRLLRVMATEVVEAISAPDAARAGGLTEAGARRALNRMAAMGLIERIGSGRTQLFRLRRADPLTRPLVALFGAEQSRYQDLLTQLRRLFEAFPEVRVAWQYDAPGEAGQSLEIGVLADSSALSYLSAELRRRVVSIESRFGLLVEFHTFSPADAPDVDWGTTVLLAGVPALPDHGGAWFGTHEDLDSRSVIMSRAIAEMLERNPTLQKRAERHVDYLIEQKQGAASHDIREWKDLLANYSRKQLKEFLVADSARAQRLRQSSPFFAALTPEERGELLDVVAQHDS